MRVRLLPGGPPTKVTFPQELVEETVLPKSRDHETRTTKGIFSAKPHRGGRRKQGNHYWWDG